MDLMQVWSVTLDARTFMHVSLAPWGEYPQLWLMHKEDTLGTDFLTDFLLLASQFSATPKNTKTAFCKSQVWLTILGITWTFIHS